MPRNNTSRTVNNQGDTEMSVLQQTNSKSWGTCDLDLNDREFKISVMKKLGEIQENSERERQFDELMNTINEPGVLCQRD